MAGFGLLCRRWQPLALTLLLAAAAVEGHLAIFRRHNDFLCHRHVGQACLDGDPYAAGCELYPVGRVFMDGVLALGPMHLTRASCYLLAIVALIGCCWIWRRLADVGRAAPDRVSIKAAFLTVLLVFPFILRDLDECGLQIFLLFFLSAAGCALAGGKRIQCSFWLATAATYKVTPILFVPYLLWKRQWQAAGWTLALTALWAAAPAFFLGAETTLRSHERWLMQTIRISGAKEAYPSLLEIEAPKPHNLSFHALVARYLLTVPTDHPLYLHHPAFVQFGALEPMPAFYAVRGALLALVLVLAWRFRRRWQVANGQPQLAAEWAAMMILCAVLSPLCWKQHLVLMLPAVFLTVRTALEESRLLTWRVAGLCVIGTVVLLSRHFIVGQAFSVALLSYKVDTLAVLLSLLLVLRLPTRAPDSVGPVGFTQRIPAALQAA